MPAVRREELLDEFERSGVSSRKFAELTGVKYQTFASWLQRRRKGAVYPAQAAVNPRWLEAVVEKATFPSGSGLTIRLPSGAQVEVNSIEQATLAAALLRHWEKAVEC
jgi:lambda repressor-like predicted transcriptional regulator